MSSPLTELAEQVAGELGIPAVTPMTDEQAAQFREEFSRRYAEAACKPLQWLPPQPLLTPELARELLRECVTVVTAGETLVIRADSRWTPAQVELYQEYADAYTARLEAPFQVLVVVGEELAVAKAVAAP